jgi:hypothetical protein
MKGGLSTGAKVGIGVGCALAALFVIAIIVFIVWHRRKNLKKKKANISPALFGKQELENKQINELNPDSEIARRELDAPDKNSVDGQIVVNELSPDAENASGPRCSSQVELNWAT